MLYQKRYSEKYIDYPDINVQPFLNKKPNKQKRFI